MRRLTPYVQRPGLSASQRVTLVPGDGIGPELTRSVQRVFTAARVPVAFELIEKHRSAKGGLSRAMIQSLRETKVAFKGPFASLEPAASLNMRLRQEMDLYVNLVRVQNVPSTQSRFQDIDMTIIRENTEGEYSGLEHTVCDGVVESIKLVSRDGCLRIAKYAFEYAYLNNRQKVTAIHKANIM